LGQVKENSIKNFLYIHDFCNYTLRAPWNELHHCMQFLLSVNIRWGSSLAKSIMAWLIDVQHVYHWQ